MTLAVILFVGILFPAAHGAQVTLRQSADPSTTAAKPTNSPGTQDSSQPAQTSPSSTKSTASPQTPTAPAKKPVTAKPRRHKKKQAASNCVPASSTTTAAPSAGSSSNPAQNGGTGGTSSSTAATPPTVCPPPKIVVRQGGTSEPAIQLAGGAVGDQAAQQRHTAIEMLSATELNLKKIDETKLTSGQQDMVKQIRQFMDQSKSATSAGDLERARTLAWKAQLLSEELVGPQK